MRICCGQMSDPSWLQNVLETFDCQTGTIHRADGDWLELVTAIGVPDSLMPTIRRIPFGKGIAGAAAATREPVELCNLQQDLGGVAKPGARATQVSGSLAVPVMNPERTTVLGTLGIGKHEPYTFTDDEKARLADFADQLATTWETT